MARSALPICGAAIGAILAHSATALAVDCFIDSVNGNDTNNGLAEDQAVKSQAKIPSTCTVAKYKRGSVFNEAVKVGSKITTYTNYGDPCEALPKFTRPRAPNNGSMFSTYTGNVTIDGLYFSGSMSDTSMSSLASGVCVMLGSNSKLLNSEITNCDIGIMLQGSGSLVQGNYIHDLYITVDAAPGVDPNAVGGAEGIFINGSDNEVAYNSFIRCTSKAEWTGGSCDGGATEVTVGAGKTLSGVKVHHNFAYQTCGFFEVSSMAGSTKGVFADSSFYNNVSIDSGWLMLLQVNNTDLKNIRWENNTVVHRKSTAINAGMLVTVFTGTSSGVSGGALQKDTVFLVNDLFVLDGFGTGGYVNALDANLNLVNTLTIKDNAGLVNVAGSNPSDFDLVAGSPAIDKGTATSHAIDYLNRTAPNGSAMDVGAFEFGATLAAGQSAPVFAHEAMSGKNCGSTGGTSGSSSSTTSTPTTATGGSTSTAGVSTKAAGGGAATNAAGGVAPKAAGGATPSIGGSGSSDPVSVGLGGAASSQSNQSAEGGVASDPATSAATANGSSNNQNTGGPDAGGALATTGDPPQGLGGAGNAVGSSTSPTAAMANSTEDGACSCRIPSRSRHDPAAAWLVVVGFGWLVRRGRRQLRRHSVLPE